MDKNRFKKKGEVLLFLLIVGAILLWISGVFSNTQESKQTSNTPEEFELCEQRCEERVATLLKQICGVKEASVLITLDELPSLKERPQVRGVAIVCSGEGSPELQLKIVMLVSSALGVTSDKIYVTFS